MKTIGIIGGSGLYRLEEFEYITSHKLNTPWGNPSDEIIEYSYVAAHNNAKAKLKTKTAEEISKTTGGFGIPGFKWPL